MSDVQSTIRYRVMWRKRLSNFRYRWVANLAGYSFSTKELAETRIRSLIEMANTHDSWYGDSRGYLRPSHDSLRIKMEEARPEPTVPNVNRLVDYPAWKKHNYSFMGKHLALRYLTPLGKEVYGKAEDWLMRLPKYRGVTVKGMFLKYVVPSGNLPEGAPDAKEFRELMVPLTDMLREMGTEVMVENTESLDRDGKPISYIRLVIT